MEEVFEVKMAKFRHDLHSQIRKIMKIIRIKVDDKSYARMIAGKRVEGTVGFDEGKSLGDLNAFNRKSREPDYVRPKDITMAVSASGWLKASVQKFKIYVSANRGMGRKRSAEELQRQALELIDRLRSTKTIEEILDEI